MAEKFTTQQVLEAVNFGMRIHKSLPDLAGREFNAEDYFATGFAALKIQAGLKAMNHLTEHDRNVIRRVGERLTAFDQNGLMLNTKPQIKLEKGVEGNSHIVKTSDNLLIAKAFADGYNTQVTICAGYVLTGDQFLTHLMIGTQRHELITPLKPADVVEGVIGLIQANKW